MQYSTVSIVLALCAFLATLRVPFSARSLVPPVSPKHVANSHLYVGIPGDGYTAGTGKIEVFSPSARGNAKPQRVLTGPHTRLANPQDFAWGEHGFLYVMDSGYLTRSGRDVPPAIFVFAPGATGDEAPVRVLSGPHVPLEGGVGIAVDSFGYAYAATFLGCPIPIFAPRAFGDARPVGGIDCTSSPASLNLVDDRILYASGPVTEFSRVSKLAWKPKRTFALSSGFMTIANHVAYVDEGEKPGVVQEYSLPKFVSGLTLTIPFPEFRTVWRVAAADDGSVYLEALRRKGKPAVIAIFDSARQSAGSPIQPSAYLEGPNTGFGSFIEGLHLGP